MSVTYLSSLVKNNSPGSGLEMVAEEKACNTRWRASNASGDLFKRSETRRHFVSLFIFLAANPNAQMIMNYTVRIVNAGAKKTHAGRGEKRIKPHSRESLSEDAKRRDCRRPIPTGAEGAGSRCAISSNHQQGFPSLGSSTRYPASFLPGLAKWTRSAALNTSP